jgi:hypothetical protein
MVLAIGERVCRTCGYQQAPTGNQLHTTWGQVYQQQSQNNRSKLYSQQENDFLNSGNTPFPQQSFPQWEKSFNAGKPSSFANASPAFNAPPAIGSLPMPGAIPKTPPASMFPAQPIRRGGGMPMMSVPVGDLSPSQYMEIVEPGVRTQSPNKILLLGLLALLIIVTGGGSWFAYSLFLTPKTASNQSPATSVPVTAPKASPVFADSFKDNGNGWNTQGVPGKASVAVGNGALTLEENNHSLLWEIVPNPTKDKARPYGEFNDFQLLVDAVLSKGDQNNSYGVYVRGVIGQNGEMTSYYRFSLYSDGTYAIFKGTVDGSGKASITRLVDYKKHAAVKAGNERNQLKIVAKGPSMTFSVNGQLLETVNDTSYQSGVIALFVINLKDARGGAQAQFSNLGIYPPDA